ncbi:MAG: M48 family metallopeptidase, partial [Hyphomonadaceae bacterium]|nr:M48 family metallopeptidase [Hyphomonadaceae bacterium]
LLGVGTWFAIAFVGHQSMIDMATKARPLTQSQAPRPYKMLENLCISRGMTMPRLKIIETEVMNAYASGIRDKNYTITLTRGLMDNLDDEELEAVIAHELSHIKNRDVRMLIIAVIFVGIISFFGEIVVRGVFRTNMPRTNRSRRGGEVNAAVLIMIAVAIIAIAYGLAMLIRFALSRKREFLADAGSVELTKNPDAMIRALEKISGRAKLNAPAEIREMAFENPKTGIMDMFATHPPIEKRIAALEEFAGGRRDTRSRPTRPTIETSPQVETAKARNPWGRPRG